MAIAHKWTATLTENRKQKIKMQTVGSWCSAPTTARQYLPTQPVSRQASRVAKLRTSHARHGGLVHQKLIVRCDYAKARSVERRIRLGQKGFKHMPSRSKMRASPKFTDCPVDLNAEDFRAIVKSVQSLTAFWHIKTTCAPSPHAKGDVIKWAYLFWVGPPSADIVPPVAITRHVTGYRIIVIDPLELFASGAFETMECADLVGTVELVREIISEAREIALDHGIPDVTAFSSSLDQLRKEQGEQLGYGTEELQELIMASLRTDTKPN